MAAEIPISLAEFHSFPYATADLLVILWLSTIQLGMIFFFLSNQLRNRVEWINSYFSDILRVDWAN